MRNAIIDKLLKYSGLNAKSFSERIGLERPQAIYDIQKGKTKNISSYMKNKIISVFPEIDPGWLMTGEGEMLRSEKSISQTVKGDGNTTNASIENKEEENNALLEALKSQQALLSKSQEHIDRLISIIEKSK